jgi:Flp pilus assembly protein TadG
MARNDDRGQSTLEVALILPVFLLLVLGLIQFALWYHAEELTIAAAQEGAAQVSAQSGSAAAGQQRAQELMSGLSPMTTGQTITVAPSGSGAVAVSITARLNSLIPGFSGFGVRATAIGHLEAKP